MYKNVNTNVMMCKDVVTDSVSGCKSLIGLFDTIRPKEFNGEYYLTDIKAVIKNNIMWDSSIVDRRDCLQLTKEYTMVVCLEENGERGMQRILYEETLDITNIVNNGHYLACNITNILNIDELKIPKPGRYSLVVLIQEKESDEELGWGMQSIFPLTIGF